MSRVPIALTTFLCLLAEFGFPAHAEVTIVENRDEPGRNSYQAHATISAACGVNGCVATFPTIRTGERVVVQYVSCWLLLPSTVSPIVVALDGQVNDTTQRAYVPAVYQGLLFSVANYVVSSPVLFYFASGDTPAISVIVNGAVASSPGDCLLTGYHVRLP